MLNDFKFAKERALAIIETENVDATLNHIGEFIEVFNFDEALSNKPDWDEDMIYANIEMLSKTVKILHQKKQGEYSESCFNTVASVFTNVILTLMTKLVSIFNVMLKDKTP